MKKILIPAVAVLALVACNKETSPSPMQDNIGTVNNEIAVNTAAHKTKGYITGETFFDTAIAELHGETPATTPREMKLSAYLTPQSGEADNYFTDFTFAKGASDGNWHHTPAVYWPIAGKLDFLAYSSQEPFDTKDVTWNEKNASESLVLNVLEDRTQDDIVYAYAYDQKSENGATAVAMQFQHTQAWLEFQIKVANSDMQDKIAIKEIIIENANNSGELTIRKESSSAKAEWSFRHEQKKNIVFEDNYNLYGSSTGGVLTNALDEEISYMDMLLPEQAKTSFVIKYYLAGQDKELQYRYELAGTGSSDNWTMGSKYVYEITFTVNEITVAPTVKAYENGDVATLFPSELI